MKILKIIMWSALTAATVNPSFATDELDLINIFDRASRSVAHLSERDPKKPKVPLSSSRLLLEKEKHLSGDVFNFSTSADIAKFTLIIGKALGAS